MSQKLLNRKFSLILLLALAFVLVTAVPAMASAGQIGDGRFCAGDNLTLVTGENVESVFAFGCNITIQKGATVAGDLTNFGGNTDIAGTIGGNVAGFGGNISLADTAVVNGEITSFGGNVNRAAGAVVHGGVNGVGRGFAPPIAPVAPVPPIAPMRPFSRGFDFGMNIVGGIITAIAFAALGALVVIFAPEPTRRVGNAVQAKPLNVAGVGCLTFILLPILMLLLIITLIGIPVAVILGFVVFVAWIFGWIALGFLTGEKILQAFRARDILPVVAVILGVLILTLLSQIWFIGWLVSFIGGLLSIGAIVLTRFGTRPYPPPPVMMMTPAVAAAGASPTTPGTYTPGPVDVALWEDKARQAQAREAQAATGPENPPAPTTPPADTPPADAGESNPPA